MTNNSIINAYYKRIYEQAVYKHLPLKALDNIDEYWYKLRECYEKPVTPGVSVRSYHNFSHIEKGISVLSSIESKVDYLSISNAVILAWLYHDSYYTVDIVPTCNELNSAKYAFLDLVGIGWRARDAGRVYDLIMLTKHDVNPEQLDHDGNLIVDIDLLGLASTPEEFIANTKNIRSEFAIYTDEQWTKGRIKFWNDLLERKEGKIFRTKNFEHLNPIALENVRKEIERLEQDIK